MKNKFLICVYFLLTLGISSLVIVESIFAFDESNNKLSRSNYEQMMIQAFEFVKENYVDPVSDEVIFEGALKGIFQSLGDPYSQYLTKKRFRRNFKNNSRRLCWHWNFYNKKNAFPR